jgi:hypothetical protein
MNTVEDKVRTALRETGEEIGPHTVPPLRLRGTRRTRLPPIPGRWGTWLTPLAAAGAVAAVVAGSLAISATFHGHAQGTGTAPAAPARRAPAGPPSLLHLVPPYFAELTDPTQVQAREAVVRSTVTGHVLATVTPPRPYNIFTWVSGATDDRTFVLAAQRWWHIGSGQAGMPAQNRDNAAPTVFFRLTFDPHTRSAQLTRLNVPGMIHSSDLAGMAVSPDGTRLALDLRQSIEIVTLATGATRTWTWPGSGWIGNWKPLGQPLSWTSGGRYLAFQQWDDTHSDTMHLRVLDTTAAGTSLTAARVLVTFSVANVTGNTFLTPDGTRVVTATVFSDMQITEYSARTGQPVLGEDLINSPAGNQVLWQEVLWAGPHGGALVIGDPRGRKTRDGPGNILGVLSRNRFAPIPHGANWSIQIAW